jgi:hypothetical protein
MGATGLQTAWMESWTVGESRQQAGFSFLLGPECREGSACGCREAVAGCFYLSLNLF